MSWTYCRGCLEKDRRIARLEEELASVKAKLRYQERTAKEAPFGSSTPSAKVLVKPNTLEENQRRRGGARPGHPGHGRKAVSLTQADRVERVPLPESCPHCGGRMELTGTRVRSVTRAVPVKVERVAYQLERRTCCRCGRAQMARPPGVFPKALYDNPFLAHTAVQHYLHQETLGSLGRQLGVGDGSLVKVLHFVAARMEGVVPRLIQEYRQAPVKHADETGWRTDGQNGYAWFFGGEDLEVFRFRKTRSASVAQEVLGQARLPGHLVVDRYNGYNHAPCPIQYCYAHLLRLVEDLEKNFPGEPEVLTFVAALAKQLARAMKLRTRHLGWRKFKREAMRIKKAIRRIVESPAKHPAVQSVQDVFRQRPDRLYHWAEDPRIPAENNLAERQLRPLVIARKISFGSQSDAGAKTRETLMTVLRTLQKRTPDAARALAYALDKLAEDPALDPYSLLFHSPHLSNPPP
jgi:transposase